MDSLSLHLKHEKKMKILEVNNVIAKRYFHKVPHLVYRKDSNWACPLEISVEDAFNPLKNAFLKKGEICRWVVLNDRNKPIGRIAAFYHSEKAYHFEQPTGGCGFFECINDKEVAFLLFDTAKEWLKSHGMEAMDGPVNPGENYINWGDLPVSLESIQRIEVIEGPASRVYGPNAFCGAINIITGTNKENKVTVSATGGEHGYYDLNGVVRLSGKQAENFIAVNRKSSDGYISNTDFGANNFFLQGRYNLLPGKVEYQAGYTDKGFGANSFYSALYPSQYERTKTTFFFVKSRDRGEASYNSLCLLAAASGLF